MDLNKDILDRLDQEVSKSIELDEIPVGAVIIDSEQNIIASGHNTRQSDNNVLGHAEVNTILEAEKVINDWRLDGYMMIVSLEPCKMCESIIKEARLDKIYYLLKSNYANSSDNSVIELNDYEPYKEKYDKYLKNFFHNMR